MTRFFSSAASAAAKINTSQSLQSILHNSRNGGINPFTLYTSQPRFNHEQILSIFPAQQWLRQKWVPIAENMSLGRIVDEERDAIQSSLFRFPQNIKTITEYHQLLGQFNAAGTQTILAGAVGGGGTRGQLPMIAGISPYQLTKNIVNASIADPGLAYSELLRAENGDALQPRAFDVLKEHIKQKALICKKAGKVLDLRAFDYANRHNINLNNLLVAVEQLHNEGITNINVGLEHSYKPDMSVQEIAQTIVGAALLGFPSGGIKSFAPNLNAHTAKEVLLFVDQELNNFALAAEVMGDKERANHFRNFNFVVHGHYSQDPAQSHLDILSQYRTDTVGVVAILAQTSSELIRPIILHATCPIDYPGVKDYKTHYSYQEILEAYSKHGIADVTDKHYEIVGEMTKAQQATIDNNKEIWATPPTAQSLPNDRPGGGGPAEDAAIKTLHSYINGEAKYNPNILALSPEETKILWNDEFNEVNKIIKTSKVTPCFKGFCDLVDHRARKKIKGEDPNNGRLPSISVDILREQVITADNETTVKAAYKQYLSDSLNKTNLSDEQKNSILQCDLDNDKISEYLKSQNIKQELQADILEASGMKMRPTEKTGGLEKAEKELTEMGITSGTDKLARQEAILLRAKYDDLAVPYIQKHSEKPKTPREVFAYAVKTHGNNHNFIKHLTQNTSGDGCHESLKEGFSKEEKENNSVPPEMQSKVTKYLSNVAKKHSSHTGRLLSSPNDGFFYKGGAR